MSGRNEAQSTAGQIPHRVLTRFAVSVVLAGLALASPGTNPQVLLLLVLGPALLAFITYGLEGPPGPPRATALTRNSR